MEYSDIIKLLGDLIGAVFAGAVIYLAPKVKEWLTEKIGKSQTDAITTLIYNLVESAEQQFKADDKDGSIRKQYVISRLTELGYEVTNQMVAIIEASVYEINGEQK